MPRGRGNPKVGFPRERSRICANIQNAPTIRVSSRRPQKRQESRISPVLAQQIQVERVGVCLARARLAPAASRAAIAKLGLARVAALEATVTPSEMRVGMAADLHRAKAALIELATPALGPAAEAQLCSRFPGIRELMHAAPQ